jgi:coniferyl-aldehyde dehydrogenase
MQREIFGPILPIKTYADRQEVANYINNHDRPLAIYLRILTIADRDSN